VDAALALAFLERRDPSVGAVRDLELEVVSHGGGTLHAHVEDTDQRGGYHLGLFVSGAYCAEHSAGDPAEPGQGDGQEKPQPTGHEHGGHDHAPAAGPGTDQLPPGCDPGCRLEQFPASSTPPRPRWSGAQTHRSVAMTARDRRP
jgi:hypothetical protein